MAKIKKYDDRIDEDCPLCYMYESQNGEYIKVSELREYLKNRAKELEKLIMPNPSEQELNEAAVAVMELSILLSIIGTGDI